MTADTNRTEIPPFGVVIPAFGHPKFLAEAIVSACEQKCDRPVRVVVVDDGCRFPETGETVSHLMASYPGTLFYLRQQNTRLPGARNAGIRFLMNLVPDIEAIYLLDADNRLSPNSLMVYWRALGDDPKVGWAYPDISFFGLTRGDEGFDTRETAPIYSPLKHLVGNISEAGSMVRADMFRAGVFYDETMTSGFEDWEYWLSALEAGYRGVRAEDTGFLYRGRPESMLADSKRLAAGLVDKIRAKHKALFNPRHVMQLEHQEAPTFALFIPEDDHVCLMSDPLAEPQIISLEDFRERFQAWAHNPVEHFFPTHIFVMPKAAWQHVQKQRSYLRWWFWRLREMGADTLFIMLQNTGKVGFNVIPSDYREEEAHVYGVASSLLWRQANSTDTVEMTKQKAVLSLPFETEVETTDRPISAQGLSADFDRLTAGFFPLPMYAKHTTRVFAGPHSRSVREILIRDICALENREPFPACTNVTRTLVAFNASLLTSTAALSKLMYLLQQLKKPDHETILLLEHEGTIENIYLLAGPKGWPSLVDAVVPFALPGSELEYSIYLGKRYQRELTATAPDEFSIVARAAERVIACGPSAAIESLGAARQHGATGYVLLSPEFIQRQDASDLGLAKLLAFEHAVTSVATDDAEYCNALSAQGFPRSKFVSEHSFLGGL